MQTFTFAGGMHPSRHISRAALSGIVELAAPPRVVIALRQHAGAPAQPLVRAGDKVLCGQVIGEASEDSSCRVHASVSGTVAMVGAAAGGQEAIVIDADGSDEAPAGVDRAWENLPPQDIIAAARASGVCGAGYPIHVKLSPPAASAVDTLIISGVENDPYGAAARRLMIEKAEAVLTGALIARAALGEPKTWIAVTAKTEAAAVIGRMCAGQYKGRLALARMLPKYPQGRDRLLISAITGRETAGCTPWEGGCVVLDVAVIFALWEAVVTGAPLYRRVVTVDGPTVANPANLLVRLGTPLRSLLQHCAADMAATVKVAVGGAMTGAAKADFDTPVVKDTDAVFASGAAAPAVRAHPCINCGRCTRVCPMRLVPSMIARLVEKDLFGEAGEWGAGYCLECGSCAYVCPSKINLVHYLKLGRYHAATT